MRLPLGASVIVTRQLDGRLKGPRPAAVCVGAFAPTTAKVLREAPARGLSTRWLTDSSFEIDGAMKAA